MCCNPVRTFSATAIAQHWASPSGGSRKLPGVFKKERGQPCPRGDLSKYWETRGQGCPRSSGEILERTLTMASELDQPRHGQPLSPALSPFVPRGERGS